MISSEQIDNSIASNLVMDDSVSRGYSITPYGNQTIYGFDGTQIYSRVAKILGAVEIPVSPTWGTDTISFDVQDPFDDHAISQVFLVGDYVNISLIVNQAGSFSSKMTCVEITTVTDNGDKFTYDGILWHGDDGVTYDQRASVYVVQKNTSDSRSTFLRNFNFYSYRFKYTTTTTSGSTGSPIFYNGIAGGAGNYGASSGEYISAMGGPATAYLLASDTRTTGFYDNAHGKILTTDSLTGGGVVFNDDSADKDFRMESDGQSYMFFLDSSNNHLGIGTSSSSSARRMYVYKSVSSGNCYPMLVDAYSSNTATAYTYAVSAYAYDTATTAADMYVYGVRAEANTSSDHDNTGQYTALLGVTSITGTGTADYVSNLELGGALSGKTITGYNGIWLYPAQSTSGSITTYWGIESGLQIGSGTTATTVHMFYMSTPDGTGTITTLNGFYLEDLSTRGTTTHGINFAGSGVTNDIFWGGDTNLYRNAANELKTDDTFSAAAFKVGATAGATGTFTTADAKTVTVTSGIITAIV